MDDKRTRLAWMEKGVLDESAFARPCKKGREAAVTKVRTRIFPINAKRTYT